MRHGYVTFSRLRNGGSRWSDEKVSVVEADLCAQRLIEGGEGQDLYCTLNTFNGRRGNERLRAIGAFFVDLDYRIRPNLAQRPPQDIVAAALSVVRDARLPLPMIVNSGRGLYLIWPITLWPAAVLPRWNAIQKAICALFADLGADRRALDASRVLRIVGSVNSKADAHRRVVSIICLPEGIRRGQRYDPELFAEALLPRLRGEIRSIRYAAARRKAAAKANEAVERRGADNDNDASRHRHPPSRKWTRQTLAEATLADLETLRAHRAPSGRLPPGKRDHWLFLIAYFAEW